MSGVARGRVSAQNDLTFSLYEWEGGYFGMAEYAAELFPAAKHWPEARDAFIRYAQRRHLGTGKLAKRVEGGHLVNLGQPARGAAP